VYGSSAGKSWPHLCSKTPRIFLLQFANAKPLPNSMCGARWYPIKEQSWTKCGSYVEGTRTTAVDQIIRGSPTDVRNSFGAIKGLNPRHLQTEGLAAEVTDCDLHGSHGLVRACMRIELRGTDFVVFEDKGDLVHILCALEEC
jgi:hypothetical protein